MMHRMTKKRIVQRLYYLKKQIFLSRFFVTQHCQEDNLGCSVKCVASLAILRRSWDRQRDFFYCHRQLLIEFFELQFIIVRLHLHSQMYYYKHRLDHKILVYQNLLSNFLPAHHSKTHNSLLFPLAGSREQKYIDRGYRRHIF